MSIQNKLRNLLKLILFSQIPLKSIWAVNSKSIVGLSHSEVVSLIRTQQNHVVFLVTSRAAHDQFVADASEPDASEATLAWEAVSKQ